VIKTAHYHQISVMLIDDDLMLIMNEPIWSLMTEEGKMVLRYLLWASLLLPVATAMPASLRKVIIIIITQP